MKCLNVPQCITYLAAFFKRILWEGFDETAVLGEVGRSPQEIIPQCLKLYQTEPIPPACCHSPHGTFIQRQREKLVNSRHANWFRDESFWEKTYPFMFAEPRFQSAAENAPKIAGLTGVSAGKVLDLACGPGRFVVPLAQAGYIITGVDRSAYLLQKAQELADRQRVSVELLEEDMRHFLRPTTFDLVLNLFTSFGYFDEQEDNERVLSNIYASLKPGGVFLFDHVGKEILASRLQPTISEALPDGTLLVQRVSVIDDWSRVDAEWMVIHDGQIHRFHNCHWLYSAWEIRQLLLRAGFYDVSVFGSFDRTPYGPKAERLVAVARKM